MHQINNYHLLCVLAGVAVVISGCNNIKMADSNGIAPTSAVESRNNNADNDNQVQQNIVKLSSNDKSHINWSSININNDEQVNEIARIVEMHDAKLQSLAYDPNDSELSLKISYYPKKLTISDFENLERDIKKLTGVNVVIDKKSIIIKPL